MALPVTIMHGRLVDDPRTQYTQGSNHALTTFRIVSSDRVQRDDGEWEDKDVCFLTVVVWRKLAEIAGEKLTKGMLVSVHGSLRTRAYETKEGEKRTALEIINPTNISVNLAGQDVQVSRQQRPAGGAPAQQAPAASAPATAPAATAPAAAPAAVAAPPAANSGSVLVETPF